MNSFRHEKVGRQAVNHFSMSGPVSQASLADCHRDNHAHSHPMNKTIEDTRDCLGGFLWLGPRGKGTWSFIIEAYNMWKIHHLT